VYRTKTPPNLRGAEMSVEQEYRAYWAAVEQEDKKERALWVARGGVRLSTKAESKRS
jgi:hypothetical protein